MTKSPRHFLTLQELTDRELNDLLALAARIKKNPARYSKALAGKSVILLFEKPSTRTRLSFEIGVHQLGAQPVVLQREDIQLGRGETLEDSSRVFSRMAHAVMIRTFAHETLERFAQASTIPVINGLSDLHHPCQVLADLLTLREVWRGWKNRSLAYVGDGNNVLHSLLLGCAKMGVSLRAATPAGFEPDEKILDAARAIFSRKNARVEVLRDPMEAVRGADAVYTDVWTSMGQEAESERRRQAFAGYTVTEALMQEASAKAVFLHCLPAHRGEEVESAVIDGPRSRVFDQAENRLHAQKALLLFLLGRRKTTLKGKKKA